MLAIISPAKTLDFESAVPKKLPHFQPHFLTQSQQLIDICRELTPADIGSLMSISDNSRDLMPPVLPNGNKTITKTMPRRQFMRSKVMFTPD